MGYLLKEALKTLCGVNQWSYAVFWKIGCQNPKLLIWEECYYEAVSCSGLLGFSGNGNLEIDFQDYNISSSSSGDNVHFLVNKMMTDSNVKTIGEGLVGRVALTGNYQWILYENYYREPHPPEVLKDVYRQFSAGMQTVTVIPVLPHGVVQLGSYLKIAENTEFVNVVMSLVLQLTENCLLHTGYSTPMSSPCRLKPHEAKIVKLDFTSQHQFINGVSKTEVIIPSNSNVRPNKQYSLCTPRSDKDSSSSGLKNSKFSKTGTSHDSIDRPATTNTIRAHDITMTAENQTIEHLANNRNYDDACMIRPQSGDDLFDVLGADFKNKLFNSYWNSCSRNEFENISSSEICSSNLDSGILSFTGTDHLLDAVVSKVPPNKSLDNSVFCGTTLTNTSSSSGSKASLTYGRFGDFDCAKEGELLGIPKSVAKDKEDSRTYSQGSCVYDLWSEKGYNVKQNNSVATGTNKPNRNKRLKPGENLRPRPKDRQMIQDRVKELREIVPNGAKCSIDALLERTIKHMLFLQGVTKHADELKPTAESKIISKNGGLLLKDNSGGGATWAYEVGSQSMVCPIIVEDLNQPHLMHVEMLCKERGLFLEIADIIRGLGLTILKGLMENQNDKIWARFTVEANRNVTRMEIFLSLVCLLDQNAKTGVSQPNSNDNDMMVQEFHQGASVPATGGPVGIC